MKEQYIKQVEKELSLPRKMKKEVVRDLNEVFASAMEHGETEQQVIQRLGTPKEFADSTAEQFGIDNTTVKKRNGIIFYSCCACLSRLLPFRYMLLHNQEKYQKEQSTSRRDNKYIQIEGAFAFDVSQILLTIGFVAMAIAVLLIIRTIQKQEVTNEEVYFCIRNHAYDFFGCVF